MSAKPSLPLLSQEVIWHDSQVSHAQRERLLGQRALTVWLTGLSAAGKSTLAFALERELHEGGRACVTGNSAAFARPTEPAGAGESAAGWRRRALSSSGA